MSFVRLSHWGMCTGIFKFPGARLEANTLLKDLTSRSSLRNQALDHSARSIWVLIRDPRILPYKITIAASQSHSYHTVTQARNIVWRERRTMVAVQPPKFSQLGTFAWQSGTSKPMASDRSPLGSPCEGFTFFCTYVFINNTTKHICCFLSWGSRSKSMNSTWITWFGQCACPYLKLRLNSQLKRPKLSTMALLNTWIESVVFDVTMYQVHHSIPKQAISPFL
jgi:hypothetical protein